MGVIQKLSSSKAAGYDKSLSALLKMVLALLLILLLSYLTPQYSVVDILLLGSMDK